MNSPRLAESDLKLFKDDLRARIYKLAVDNKLYWLKYWGHSDFMDGSSEAVALKMLKNHFSDVDCLNIPNLICFNESLSFIVTEDFPGKSVNQLLRNPLNAAQLPRYLDLINNWISCFTDFKHAKTAGTYDYRKSVAQLSLWYNSCYDNRLISARQLNRISELVAEVTSVPLELQTFPNHGDFNASNVLIKDDNICVIDFMAFKFGSVYSDIAHMFLSLYSFCNVNCLIEEENLYRLFLDALIEKYDLNVYYLDLEIIKSIIRKIYYSYDNFRHSRPLRRKTDPCLRVFFFRRLLDKYLKSSIVHHL